MSLTLVKEGSDCCKTSSLCAVVPSSRLSYTICGERNGRLGACCILVPYRQACMISTAVLTVSRSIAALPEQP